MPFATKPIDHWDETAAILPSSPFMAGLDPDHYVLDIGCGVLRNGVVLMDYLNPGRYFGFDKEPDYWEHDPAFEHCCIPCVLKQWKHKQPYVWRADAIEALPVPWPTDFILFDRVIALSVLLHMTPEVIEHTMQAVRGAMNPDAVWLSTVNLGEHDEGLPHEERDGELFNARRPFDWYDNLARQNGMSAQPEPSWIGPNGRTVDVISFRRA